jgi:hypothetical protein
MGTNTDYPNVWRDDLDSAERVSLEICRRIPPHSIVAVVDKVWDGRWEQDMVRVCAALEQCIGMACEEGMERELSPL